jgi:hypothetical protein
MTKVINQAHGDTWSFFNADCVEFTAGLPDCSIDHCVYSPPFSSLYIYSDSERDMGNSADDAEFMQHYSYLLSELYRATRPGRVHAVHVKDLVYYQGSSERGTSGLRDFSGEVIRAYVAAGFDFHSRITVYRDPVLERAKTNAHGLLWKTFQADSSFCRTGLPEYVLVFRRWPQNEAERELIKPVKNPKSRVPLETWQDLASPVWSTHEPEMWLGKTGPIWSLKPSGMGDGDLPATDTLNVKVAREDRDEKHLCPMPLNITRRCLRLWTSPGDSVYSPFGGIGSEGYVCMQEGRRFIGAELKPAYWKRGIRYLQEAERAGVQSDLFGAAA